MAMRKIATIVLLISLGSVYGQNLVGNAGLEDLTPAFWTPVNATMGGEVDVSATAKYGFSSFMISKSAATTTEKGWMSDDNANLYWNNAGTGTFAVSAWYKTDGVNTSPANEDAKIGVEFTFNNASGTELATTTLYADQTAATTDWTELTGVVILGEAPEQVFVKQYMGKDATGTVYFDGIGCNTSDSWTMGVFNSGAEDVDGWMDWYGGNGNYTYVTDAQANTGTNSIVMAQPDTMTSMSELVYYSIPYAVEAGEWYKVGVWVKTEAVVDSSAWGPTYIMTDNIQQRVNLCYFFHTDADLDAGWSLVGGDKFVYVDQRDPTTGWTHYVVAEQAPAEATGISVRARFNPNTTGTAYFDDFSVEKITSASDNLVGNAGVEDLTPAFWTPVNATMGGEVDVSATAKYGFSSFMISKSAATTTEKGWMSDDNANLYWNNAGTVRSTIDVERSGSWNSRRVVIERFDLFQRPFRSRSIVGKGRK